MHEGGESAQNYAVRAEAVEELSDLLVQVRTYQQDSGS